ncbi:hypothetical protein TSMEX_009679 [Taenia solium]|eukprot:TsM_001035900 transcript=TsM_001035900 gene=TsM_001035900
MKLTRYKNPSRLPLCPVAVAAVGGNPFHPATAVLVSLGGQRQQQQQQKQKQSVLWDGVEGGGDKDNVDELDDEEDGSSETSRSGEAVSEMLKKLPTTANVLTVPSDRRWQSRSRVGRNGENCGLLRNYPRHRVYGFPLTRRMHAIVKGSVLMWVNCVDGVLAEVQESEKS